MFKNIAADVRHITNNAASFNAFQNTYAFARSILATGTLTTLLFNKWSLLFPESYCSQIQITTIFEKFNLFILCGYKYLNLALILSCVTLATVIIGYGTRVTGILQFWIAYSFFHYCPMVDGGDQITQILTFCLIPFTLFAKRKNHWDKKNHFIYSPYINIIIFCITIFIQLQMAVLYFHAAVDKLKVEEWLNGTDVYYWFTHNVFGFPSWCRSFLSPLLFDSFIVSSITWGTIILEILLFGCFFMTYKRRKRLFYIALAFHFGILIIHGLVSFFFAMAGGLILYLLPLNRSINFKIKAHGPSRKSNLT